MIEFDPAPAAGRLRMRSGRIVIGIGQLAVSTKPDEVIVTHALGSCVAVCLFDPIAGVAAMLHFLLPDSRINETRARVQPAAFADTGIPLLFQTAYQHGLEKRHAIVKLAGGADTVEGGRPGFMTGRRNALAARHLLWQNGVLISAQDIGGSAARTVHLSARDGRVLVHNGSELKEL